MLKEILWTLAVWKDNCDLQFLIMMTHRYRIICQRWDLLKKNVSFLPHQYSSNSIWICTYVSRIYGSNGIKFGYILNELWPLQKKGVYIRNSPKTEAVSWGSLSPMPPSLYTRTVKLLRFGGWNYCSRRNVYQWNFCILSGQNA